MEKEVKERSSKTQGLPPKPAMIFPNTANLTNPERSSMRRLVSDLKHLSFAANLSAVANQEVEDDYETLPTEDPYVQAASQHQKLEVMMQQRAKAIKESPSTSLGNYDLLVLSNAASLAVSREVSNKEVVVAPEESLQRRGKAAPLKLVKQVKPISRDVSDSCQEDKWFKKKYVRKKSKNTRIKTVEGQYRDSGVKDKTKIKIQSRDENQEIARKSSLITHIFGTKNQEIPKRKRSQRKRKPGSSGLGTRREENERDCDQNGSNAGDPEIAPDEDIDADKPEEEEENTIFEADFNQTVLESDIAEEDGIVSEPESFLSLLERLRERISLMHLAANGGVSQLDLVLPEG